MSQARIVTRSQAWMERAYACVSRRQHSGTQGDYLGFAKRFPSLIHTCGLAQALAFAEAKAPEGFVEDLNAVLAEPNLAAQSRNAGLTEYLRLSRNALATAGWIKRYAEALLEKDTKGAVDASQS